MNKELEKLQKLADRQRQEKAKLEGKIENLLENLSAEGWDSIEKARRDMVILEKKIIKMKKVFENKLHIFKEKYADKLET